MKIVIHTNKPETLLADIFRKAEDEDLKTWEVREDNQKEKFITHTGQWKDEALLKFSPKINENKLIVTISWWEEKKPTETTKGIYIGRFSEALLNHFNKHFSSFETFN